MSIFTFNLKDTPNVLIPLEDKDPDYPVMCMEFNKIISKYIINQELHSEKLWNYLKETFAVNEDSILQKTEISLDEKNKAHKGFKYYVKCQIGRSKFYVVFLDEFRNMEDEDYHDSVINNLTPEDKTDKANRLIIYYDSSTISTKQLEDTVISKMLECSYMPSMKNQFFTIATNSYSGGYEIRPSYVKQLEINLELNYGPKFVDKYEKIVEKLKNEKHGLFLFYGKPGTGKTVLIRKLISELSEKKTIIYVPSYMMQNIADPELISFISGFKNTILLLEDAEDILTKGSDERPQAVSNILNMTDGLLNDYMQMQIISTFNTDLKMIDPALRRAGRLVASHKFDKLSKDLANKLAEKIGSSKVFDKGATLAEIYEGTNQILDDDDLTSSQIGFKI